MELTSSQMIPNSMGGWIGAVVATIVLYYSTTAFYNLYFHPLAKFPGPASNAAFYATNFWSIYKGTNHDTIKQLHAKYGDVVRIQPNQLSFSSKQAWKDIYGSRPGKGQLPKDPKFYTLPGLVRTNIIYSDDADHTRMRKLLSHAFSDAALREQEPILNHYFDLLVQSLSTKCSAGKSVDILSYYNWFTFDVIGSLAFAEDFGSLANGEYHGYIRNVFQNIKLGRMLSLIAHYSLPYSMFRALTMLMPSLVESRAKHDIVVRQKTKKRMAMETDRKDFMNYILRYNDERGMSQSEIEHTSSVLLIAGSETTATLLSGATYLLLTNPEIYERAKAEVRSAFSAPEHMTLASTARLPYLHAVMEESLRLYPPVPSSLPRSTGGQWAAIDGYAVPPNTSLAVPQWTVNTSPKHWAKPQAFVPERWLEKPPAEFEADNKAIMNPFSIGPRNCIGKNLAYNEMRSVMARMLWHFDMELCSGMDGWRDQLTFTIWEKKPLNIKLSFVKR